MGLLLWKKGSRWGGLRLGSFFPIERLREVARGRGVLGPRPDYRGVRARASGTGNRHVCDQRKHRGVVWCKGTRTGEGCRALACGERGQGGSAMKWGYGWVGWHSCPMGVHVSSAGFGSRSGKREPESVVVGVGRKVDRNAYASASMGSGHHAMRRRWRRQRRRAAGQPAARRRAAPVGQRGGAQCRLATRVRFRRARVPGSSLFSLRHLGVPPLRRAGGRRCAAQSVGGMAACCRCPCCSLGCRHWPCRCRPCRCRPWPRELTAAG